MVTQKKATVFTDGRYDIQVEKQLKGSSIDFIITNFPNAKTPIQWMKEQFKKKKINIGVDGKVVSVSDPVNNDDHPVRTRW